MSDANPMFTLKITAEKFKMIDNDYPASRESENDDTVTIDTLNDDDCTDYDDE